MNYISNQLQKTSLGFVLACGVLSPVFADDIEIYTDANLIGAVAQPNIMFVMDSSAGMNATLAAPVEYEFGTTYVGGYDATKIYYTDDGSIPATNGDYFDWNANHCDHAEQEYVAGVAQGSAFAEGRKVRAPQGKVPGNAWGA